MLTGTESELALLHILTHKIRTLTFAQISRTWWPQARTLHRHIDSLVDQGLVGTTKRWAHPEIPITDPVLTWEPNEPDPDCGAVAYRLQKRWTLPPVEVSLAIATKKTAQLIGGTGGRFPRRSEVTHDIHHAQVFLRMRMESPLLAESWLSEADIYKEQSHHDQKLPDAVITENDRLIVIEFGGAYAKRHVEEFHQWCKAHELPYRLY